MGEYEQARQDAYRAGDYDAIERIIDAEAAGETVEQPKPVNAKRKGTHWHRDPGAGAVEFAREQVGELTGEEGYDVVRSLITRPAEEYGDKRVKVCVYCRYLWRDPSLRNTRGTCSDECKTALRSEQTAIRRKEQAMRIAFWQVKEEKRVRISYFYWLEYPFWVNEYDMLKRTWKHEVSGYDQSFLDKMSTKNETIGPRNRKKPKRRPQE
ncbi:hypothetical protein [Paenibacillus sp. P22]|uniref:hypothetical protein n=1 Tax=Paenibacillus sp. P22 TaxID=483908 RepID=UPI000430F6D7|nr:hypothetical protein [Paenibacillus sp. P22]CDN45391.1 Uncharacterized protein BN871_HI_00120 [Paenibacillus sp. P22]